MPSQQKDDVHKEGKRESPASPPATVNDDGELTTAECSRQRQEQLYQGKKRKFAEETEKKDRIARDKEEAKKKRVEATAKKQLEEDAACILAGGLSQAAAPFQPAITTTGARRRSRDEDEEEGGEQGGAKKQGVGSPMRTSRLQQPESSIKVDEVDMGIRSDKEGEGDGSKLKVKGPLSILKWSGGVLRREGRVLGQPGQRNPAPDPRPRG